MARSTSPPAGAGPSATSCGSMPLAWTSEGTNSSESRISSRRSMLAALVGDAGLVEVRPQPALGAIDRHRAPLGIILKLVAADSGDTEILAVAMAEVKAGDRRRRKHREILGQGDLARMPTEHLEQHRLQA